MRSSVVSGAGEYPFTSILDILSLPVFPQPLELDAWVDNFCSGYEQEEKELKTLFMIN